MKIRFAVALAVALGCLYPSLASAEDSYLCIGDQATGFGFHEENKAWSVQRFQPTKLILRKTNTLIVNWQVYDFDKNIPIMNCKGDFDEEGFLRCDGVAQFLMSKEKLRFMYIYALGYWSDSDKYPAYKEGTNRPWMEIGRCSRFYGAGGRD